MYLQQFFKPFSTVFDYLSVGLTLLDNLSGLSSNVKFSLDNATLFPVMNEVNRLARELNYDLRKLMKRHFRGKCALMQTLLNIEAAIQRCSYKKVFWKYTANLQENAHTELQFQYGCFTTLLKSHFGVLLYICCIFSEYLFVRTHLEGNFCTYNFNLLWRVIFTKAFA